MDGFGDAAARWIGEFHRRNPAPALSVALAWSDGRAWHAALGQADLELGVPARPEQLFRLASVSKPITATAAALVALRGTVDLDAPIAELLPDLSQHHRQTSLRQLLTHRAGIRHYTARDLDPTAPGGPLMMRRDWSREAVLAAFIDDDLVAPPGTRVSYSSWGYSLASIVLEQATGTPFLDIIAAEIAAPFALPSLCADDPQVIIRGRVSGYASGDEFRMVQARFPAAAIASTGEAWQPALPANPAYCWAGAGLLMNMPELARFGAAMPEGPHSLIGDAERRLLFTPVTEATEASPPLGLGWRIDRDGLGRLRWHHAGATPGGRACLVVYPADGLAIAIAGNCMLVPGDVLGASAELADLASSCG